MRPLSSDEIANIANLRNLTYEAIPHENPLVVRTRISRVFPVSQQQMFDAFADPVAHVGLFPIIVGSTSPIRRGLEGVLRENEFFAFEHVQESTLPPRIMVMKYTLDSPNRISKVGVTDPFVDSGNIETEQDRKKANVIMDFERVDEGSTKLTTDGEFTATTGAIFARGFIDHVWLNFFERLMVANGQLTELEMMTEPKLG